jgi:ribosomal protein S18 acetylase RimI-like enzyme
MTVRYSSQHSPVLTSLISEVASLSEQIFSPSAIDYSWRLVRMPEASVFCARVEGRLVGFKAGYAIAEHKYYSWLGAVHPEYRGRGIASKLAALQHEWLASQGYRAVETSSRDGNAAMAKVNFASGFAVVGSKLEPHGLQVLWSKSFS